MKKGNLSHYSIILIFNFFLIIFTFLSFQYFLEFTKFFFTSNVNVFLLYFSQYIFFKFFIRVKLTLFWPHIFLEKHSFPTAKDLSHGQIFTFQQDNIRACSGARMAQSTSRSAGIQLRIKKIETLNVVWVWDIFKRSMRIDFSLQMYKALGTDVHVVKGGFRRYWFRVWIHVYVTV